MRLRESESESERVTIRILGVAVSGDGNTGHRCCSPGLSPSTGEEVLLHTDTA